MKRFMKPTPAFYLLFAMVVPASADTTQDLARRLEDFRAPGPLAATVHLELLLEHTVRRHISKGEASIDVDVARDEGGLHVTWRPFLLTQADAEESDADRASDRLRPLREALIELDPARLAHLLDQRRTLAGLTSGTPVEDSAQDYEGQRARRLVYRFHPRLSPLESYYARRSDGQFILWVTSDGTPLASESVATFEGKTSRFFGRFQGKTSVRTRYATGGRRLWVGERTEDDTHSRDDGSEVDHTRTHFAIDHHDLN